MKMNSLTCNECGAPIEVPQKIRFVTCSFCQARLEIHRTDSSVYTEAIERIDENTQKISSDLEVIRAQNELQQLDREWLMEREHYMIHDKRGSHLPNNATSFVSGAFVLLFGLIWILITLAARALPFTIFGIIFVVIVLKTLVSNSEKSSEFNRRHREYSERRRRLLNRIG